MCCLSLFIFDENFLTEISFYDNKSVMMYEV